jgi:hypothetical protein
MCDVRAAASGVAECGCSTVSVISVVVAATVSLSIACQSTTIRHAPLLKMRTVARGSSSRIPTASVASAAAVATAITFKTSGQNKLQQAKKR